MAELATYSREGRIATITIDDGKVNAFSIRMLRSIHAALDLARSDGAVVVLTGREGCFSAGFDLGVFAGSPDGVLEMLLLGAGLAERVLAFQTPVVVACSGHAVAAGAFLPLSADMRIGADGPFQIGLNEVRIGLTVPWFAVELARRRLHPAHFDRAVVSAAMYSPADAVPAGFLDLVVPAAELQAASMEAAGALATLDPAAHAATKLRARATALKNLRAAIEGELTPEGLAPSPVAARGS
ncbi:MAG TPA: crotonase/enoyl-CoA hydratase family protein [Solirubrobacteraceae bacterium]|nr:crotonase/enoyl-CoA hydratase family protein [Solirubrobacteraceae bacterium]